MTSPRSASGVSPSTKWSLYAGIYAFLCAGLLLLVISQVATLVADVLVLPTDSVLWLAVPVPVIGALVWWGVVERRGNFSYPRGGAVGLISALLAVGFWLLRAATVWELQGVLAGWPLVFVVLVPTVPAALLAGLPIMYARKQLGDVRLNGVTG